MILRTFLKGFAYIDDPPLKLRSKDSRVLECSRYTKSKESQLVMQVKLMREYVESENVLARVACGAK